MDTKRILKVVPWLAATIGTVACMTPTPNHRMSALMVFPARPAAGMASTEGRADKWTAEIHSPAAMAFIGGKATIEQAGGSMDSTQVSIQLIGADTVAPHPWRVHMNPCGSKTGSNLAPISAFPAVRVSTSPDPNAPTAGSASVVLHAPMPMSGKYSVEVFATSKDTTVAIACGDFVKMP